MILPHTLSLFNTRSASASPEVVHFLHGSEASTKDGRMTGDLSEKVEVLKGEDAVSPAWEWVGVVRVRGRGRGIVNQADGVIRRWVCLKLIDMIIYEDQSQNIVTQEPAFSNL
ncbi:hypothetical protein L204_103095 [Cryptococcus depauperatus]